MNNLTCLLASLCIDQALAFGLLDSFKTAFTPKTGPSSSELLDLKNQLRKACNTNDRTNVEAVIEELKILSPITKTASSPLLQKNWLLDWTTEKEINFFVEWNLCPGGITQLIDGTLLENNIPFKNGGFLGVTGALSIEGDQRTNFEFTEATLDLGFLGPFTLPPVGKGWFDTVYLDDELRVDTNSRDDILICSPIVDS